MTFATGEIISIVALAFGTSIITTFFANLFNMRANSKNQALKYITEERAKWRKFIKESAAIIYSNKYTDDKKKVISEFILSLNPSKIDNILDNKICDILELIELEDNPSQPTLADFLYCVSVLLKHDWERSKDEAKTTHEDRAKRILIEFEGWLNQQTKNIE
jgi:hypothetical protein